MGKPIKGLCVDIISVSSSDNSIDTKEKQDVLSPPALPGCCKCQSNIVEFSSVPLILKEGFRGFRKTGRTIFVSCSAAILNFSSTRVLFIVLLNIVEFLLLLQRCRTRK
uniref:Candidate secreted effector n=1 Tax=Meloidogyne incognita TaxID=6306 RepID=A0A914LBB8_MELIC